MTSSELSLIQRIAAGSTVRPGTRIGIGDDAAVLDGHHPTVVTHDLLVQDVHFRLPTSAYDLGHKALAVNLSDLAAMGARPVAVLVGLILPPTRDIDVDEFYAGMEALAERTGVTVAGGDISSGRDLCVAVCAIGELAGGVPPLTRTEARAGDLIVVTETLGGSEAGRALIDDEALAASVEEASRSDVIRRHLRPEPAFRAAQALRDAGARAAMDCSDGLILDAGRMAEASGCGAIIDLERVPIAEGVATVAVAQGTPPDVFAATAGEDYCLIAAVPGERIGALEADLADAVAVGRFTAGQGVQVMRNGEAVSLSDTGYVHDV